MQTIARGIHSAQRSLLHRFAPRRWTIAGGQLVVSSDIRELSPLQRDILLNTELLGVFNDSLKTPGTLVHGMDQLGTGISVWSRPLDGGCVAVGVLNGGNTTVVATTVELTWLPGDWDNSTRVSVRDMWAHTDLPRGTGNVTVASLSPHATTALRLCRVA